MNYNDYVIGVDFGTSSVRSIISDGHSGEQIALSEFLYPRWKEKRFCDSSKNQFRQHPLDYVEGLEHTIKDIIHQAGPGIQNNIKAISMATTGSTPVAVDKNGSPLALKPGFEDNPNAMFFLWKDHSAIKEAAEINKHGNGCSTKYLKYVGGIYSSEWYWAKLLHALREDEKLRNACCSWVEHCDWMPFLITGGTDISEMKRSVCAAGHKGLWADEFGGFPPEKFFSDIDMLLAGFRSGLPEKTYAADEVAGALSLEWAKKLGLSTKVIVGMGAMDAHVGAVGSQIEPYYLSKVMGTSTCDMIVAPISKMKDVLVQGICGQVQDSIIPGMIGMEAGQSAFGDIYAWFGEIFTWPVKNVLCKSGCIDDGTAEKLVGEIKDNILFELSEKAAKLPIDEETELAVDWMNGRRTPYANQLLKGAIGGLSLGSTAPHIFRSLVEATCFGSRRIVEHFIEEGIPVKGLIGVGGVAKKSPFIMQMMADVVGMPIKIHKSEQTCAVGASMFAATVAGIYPKVEVAMEFMGQGFEKEYCPDVEKSALYNLRYGKYKHFGDFIERETSKPEKR